MPSERFSDPQQRSRLAVLAAIVIALVIALVVLIGGSSSDPDPSEVAERKAEPAGATAPAAAPKPKGVKLTPELRRDTGSVLIAGFSGTTAKAALLDQIREGLLAGVILMGDNIKNAEQLTQLTESLRRAADEGGQPLPLIMTDQEGGEIRRIKSLGPKQSAAKLGRGSVEDVRSAGHQTGKDLAAVGINVDLAPVADVLTNPDAFIGDRAFGTRSQTVAEYACAFAGGLVSGGVAATLKHFPGLGGAGETSSDDEEVEIDDSRLQIEASWDAWDECGSDSRTLTMLSNASYPQMTGTLPAVISGETYRSLRELGVVGPYITDSLDALGVNNRSGLAVDALTAGADILLYTLEGSAERARRQLQRGLRSGALDPGVLKLRAGRVMHLRRLLGG